MEFSPFRQIMARLVEEEVKFVVIGGVAATLLGSSYITRDLDICYERTPENVEKLCRALAPLHPGLRGAPPDLPFKLDPPTVLAGFNFTLRTDVAALALLVEVLPIGTYPQVVAQSVVIQLPDFQVRSLSLDALIQAKRTAGRVKDLQLLPELEALRAKQEDINGGS